MASFVSSFVASTLRSNFADFVGYQITVGASPVTVTHLGRWVVAGNSGTHTVKLADASGVDVSGGSVSVNTSGATSGAFLNVALGTPIVLSASTIYFLGSQEANAGDQWYDSGLVITHASVAVINGAAYVSSGVWNLFSANPNDGFVPVNFLYDTGGPGPGMHVTMHSP